MLQGLRHLSTELRYAPLGSFGPRHLSTGLGFDSATAVHSLRDKVFLVTGSTSGIGRVTAEALAQQQATVLVHGRKKSRVQRTLQEIRASTSNERVFGYTYDVSCRMQLLDFAANVRRDADSFFHGKLDVLINNAGVFMEDPESTPEGLEMTWAVNVAAPFVLAAELLDCITERIVNVSSISLADSLDWDNTQAEKSWDRNGHAAYNASKLAVTMWSYRLAKQLKEAGSPVTVPCVDPGTVNTKLLYNGWGSIAHVALPLEDADDEYWAATSNEAGRDTGKYFVWVNKQARLSPSFSYDEKEQLRLWHLLESQTGVRMSI